MVLSSGSVPIGVVFWEPEERPESRYLALGPIEGGRYRRRLLGRHRTKLQAMRQIFQYAGMGK